MNHRPERLRSLLLSLGSEILTKLKDPAVHNGLGNEIISFTDVKVSQDLRHANYFVSILASEPRKEEILAGLNRSANFFHRELRSNMRSASIPAVNFILDNTMEKASHLMKLINEANKDLPPLSPEEKEKLQAEYNQDIL